MASSITSKPTYIHTYTDTQTSQKHTFIHSFTTNYPLPTNLPCEALHQVRPHLLILLQTTTAALAPLPSLARGQVDPPDVEDEEPPPLGVPPLCLCVCVVFDIKTCGRVCVCLVLFFGGRSVHTTLRKAHTRTHIHPSTHIHVYTHTRNITQRHNAPAESSACRTRGARQPPLSPSGAGATGPPAGGSAGNCARRARPPPRRRSGSGGTGLFIWVCGIGLLKTWWWRCGVVYLYI